MLTYDHEIVTGRKESETFGTIKSQSRFTGGAGRKKVIIFKLFHVQIKEDKILSYP